MALQKSRPPGFSNVVGLVKRDQVVAGVLRDSVVLCRALGRICNGHPASVVVKNQRLPNIRFSNFSVPSSFEPDGPVIDALAQESRVCRAAAISGGISGGTPNYDVKKVPLIQILSPFIRILFAAPENIN